MQVELKEWEVSHMNKRIPEIRDYDIISVIGEGSFGKVYKARYRYTNEPVAYKVIAKTGRTPSDLLVLRRECEIQQHLRHPNIIRMLDSFETEYEIVVVTEFAVKALFDILGEEKVLPEVKAQKIICDLVSALYYLHSHRILHRDLKPQNVLIDKNGIAKLCDFGFARTLNTGSHVLTSIKGTPLYMAPELIGENPYDHNADLWSLGCISYELAVGHPPFTTTSILHLVRMVRKEAIVWPKNISVVFLSFLKGLLQKDPTNRLSWPHLLYHPFVHNQICLVENNPAAMAVMSYTTPNIVNRVSNKENQHFSPSAVMPPAYNSTGQICNCNNPHCSSVNPIMNQISQPMRQNEIYNPEFYKPIPYNFRYAESALYGKPYSNINQSPTSPSNLSDNAISGLNEEISNLSLNRNDDEILSSDDDINGSSDGSSDNDSGSDCVDSGNGSVETENEEWLEFITNNIKDVMSGDIEALSERTMLTMITRTLRNENISHQVIDAIVKLLSLPFVVRGISKSDVEKIRKVYINCEVVSDLLFAAKQIVSAPENNSVVEKINSKKVLCLENLFVLLCNLSFSDHEFLQQFCETCSTCQMHEILRILLLCVNYSNTRIVSDILAIAIRILNDIPTNFDFIDKIIFGNLASEQYSLELHDFLSSKNEEVCTRMCLIIILLMEKNKTALLEKICNSNSRLIDDLSALKNRSSSLAPVASTAECTVKRLLNV